jgi:hypothetical protein
MSANDYLYLTKKGDKFVLSHRDADTDAELERWEFNGLEEALARAEEEQGRVEYGIVFGFGVKLKGEGKKPSQEKLPSFEQVAPLKLRKGQKCWLCKKEIKGAWCYNGYHWWHPACKEKDTQRVIREYLKKKEEVK